MDRFRQILYDLGKEIGIDLYPDSNGICQLNYKDKLHIQIHYEEGKERLMIATFVCECPPGKYREKLLKEALKSNGEYPRIGTLAYSERNNQLTLFEYLYAAGLRGETLFNTLKKFVEKTFLWKDAVETGKPLPTSGKTTKGNSMFGLEP